MSEAEPTYGRLPEAADPEQPVRVVVPKAFLHGTMRNDEYGTAQRRKTEALLEREGLSLLTRKPVKVCALPVASGMRLAILDTESHYLARYARTQEVPCEVVTAAEYEDTVAAAQGRQPDYNRAQEALEQAASDAVRSFETVNYSRHPNIVPRHSPDNLRQMFRTF